MTLLGIEQSITGQSWYLRTLEEQSVQQLRQVEGLSELSSRILSGRGVKYEGIEDFLDPRVHKFLPDPSCMKDMDVAADRLVHAIQNQERIAICTDYDVDGATSAALLGRFWRCVSNVEPFLYIPDRITEGYGLSLKGVRAVKQEGISLLVTLDCGTNAFEALQESQHFGLQVLILDHHTVSSDEVQALALVNPQRRDDNSHLQILCSVGVVFLTIIAINRLLRERGQYYVDNSQLLSYLDLVALGTVCDGVPLKGLNRALVYQGLKVLNKGFNVGLRCLRRRFALLGRATTTDDMSFIFGPRLNAGGRVGSPFVAVRLLMTDDETQAEQLSISLDEQNKRRREIESRIFTEALSQISNQETNFVFVVGQRWHPGVIGIIATRLAERFQRPSCVITVEGEYGTGSGRSVDGFHFGEAILQALEDGLLIKGGGHAMAAGFTIHIKYIAALQNFFQTTYVPNTLSKKLYFDDCLEVSSVNSHLLQQIENLGPFGTDYEEPLFVLKDVCITDAHVVGSIHIKVRITDRRDKSHLKGMAFRTRRDTPLGQLLLSSQGKPLHLAGIIKRDTFLRRDNIVFIVKDAAFCTDNLS